LWRRRIGISAHVARPERRAVATATVAAVAPSLMPIWLIAGQRIGGGLSGLAA
jgi:hypothetical protein